MLVKEWVWRVVGGSGFAGERIRKGFIKPSNNFMNLYRLFFFQRLFAPRVFACLFSYMTTICCYQVAVNIIEGYIILGGTDFLNMQASCVAKLLDLVVGNVNDKGLLIILPVIDMLIQVHTTCMRISFLQIFEFLEASTVCLIIRFYFKYHSYR